MIIPEYISHIRRNKNSEFEFQSNKEHSLGVAELASQFANEFGMGEWGYVMGLLHDKGKETSIFQSHIKKASGLDCRADDRGYMGHAYVGGQIAKKKIPSAFPFIGNPIMGHHRGLYDYDDLEEELKKSISEEVPWGNLPQLSYPKWFVSSILQSKDFHHIERMLFSCLVDADYLDTERFMQPEQYKQRGSHTSMSELLQKLEDHLASFGEPKTEVNRIRNEVQQCCREKADGVPGFYSLTVPTGGGKTLASLVWALHHAVVYGKCRIIIAIPYTRLLYRQLPYCATSSVLTMFWNIIAM